MSMSFWLIKKACKVDDSIVIDGNHGVCISSVMDPWDVFVTDALNAVCSESVI